MNFGAAKAAVLVASTAAAAIRVIRLRRRMCGLSSVVMVLSDEYKV